ncbi:SDR family NAD(P)-dependent oxidoreductase [Caulobacter segnis]|uniref:SDR family oxidoreductase n=1 Tax=Caulobacter segnis TaxID=88688 RepID=UPI002410146E|nr:SDR family oxidoreductase [Caulobacter segnis]MDG2520377.1 SDR family NAD(P)-dependent oxidoreductase [Caulobacter segnis]
MARVTATGFAPRRCVVSFSGAGFETVIDPRRCGPTREELMQSAPPPNPLEDAGVLIAGGTTGIGREIALGLARRGARVFVFGREGEPLAEVAEQAQAFGATIRGVTADMSMRADVDRAFAAFDAQVGRLDAFVGCAALGAGPLARMEEDAWRYVVETNLIGTMACTRRAIDRLKPHGGRIVLIGSVAADLRAEGESVYAATKAGVQAFVEALRREERAHDVRISLVEPGATATDMQPMNQDAKARSTARAQMLHAADIARGVLYMLSEPLHCDVSLMRIVPARQAL